MLKQPLTVQRTLTTGEREVVGTLAESRQGVFFQYDAGYLSKHENSLSPFRLKHSSELQRAPNDIHYGLHGVFADSLPDGWGLYVMDRVFRQHGYAPQQVTALERLAFLGDNCLGALSYTPALELSPEWNAAAYHSNGTSTGNSNQATQPHETVDAQSLVELGKSAVQEFEGSLTGDGTFLKQLMAASGSGGARPKLTVTKTASGEYSTRQDAVGEKLIIKLTSDKFALQHYESVIEYIYLLMAREVGIDVPDFELLDVGDGRYWLQLSRFDCPADNPQGRYHMVSACGLLDAPFRHPSLDYIDLIKVTRLLCGVQHAQQMLKRALFNFVMVNQDDHSKNFAFLADDADNWRPSPCYDVVYSPSPYGEHMTAFNGNGKYPDKNALEQMALQAGFANSKPVYAMLDEIYDVAQRFSDKAKQYGVSDALIGEIQREIERHVEFRKNI